MTKLLASVFSGFAMFFGGMFGHHMAPNSDMGSTTPDHQMASTTPWGRGGNGMGSTTPGHMGMMPGVMGEVVSISGTSLTVSGHNGMNSATTTFTVDASSAKIIIGGMASGTPATVADIKSGDKVMIDGTVSGTSVTAKVILDGLMIRGGKGMGMHGDMKNGPMQPAPAAAQ